MRRLKPPKLGLALAAGLWFFGIAARKGFFDLGGVAESGDCTPTTGWV